MKLDLCELFAVLELEFWPALWGIEEHSLPILDVSICALFTTKEEARTYLATRFDEKYRANEFRYRIQKGLYLPRYHPDTGLYQADFDPLWDLDRNAVYEGVS